MTAAPATPRIAILGFAIESNRFAPVSGRADFESRAYLAGASLLADARSAPPAMTPEIPAFVRRMDQRGPWTPLTILFANAESAGPVEHAFFLAPPADRKLVGSGKGVSGGVALGG